MCAENVECHAFRFLLETLQRALAPLGTSAVSEEEIGRDLPSLLGGLTEPWCKEIIQLDLLSLGCPGACL